MTIDELLDVGIGRAMGIAGMTSMGFRRPNKSNYYETKEDEEKKEKKFKKNNYGVSSKFYESIKSRQVVDQLVDQTTQSAEFTYDYMSMLIVANIIAAMGLATNSAVSVVASMLVSPIMGPVLALTFGVHLRKFKFAQKLAKLGLKNEIWSLLICILEGFIMGLILLGATENNFDPEWPTNEMTSRGTLSGLATGAIIAAASGVGVALSVVGDYMATVVGVAISASLLPPAVNCGILWATSLYAYFYPEWFEYENNPRMAAQNYTATSFAEMGAISIALTVENIILVFLTSWFMFIIKDVAVGNKRDYDDNNKQLVYQSITNFKDRYDDIKIGQRSYNIINNKKRGKTSDLNKLTADKQIKEHTLKKTLMSFNTLRRRKTHSNVIENAYTLNRVFTEFDGDYYYDKEKENEMDVNENDNTLDRIPSKESKKEEEEEEDVPLMNTNINNTTNSDVIEMGDK